MEFVFDHERLEVYQVARQLSREVRKLVETLPPGSGESRDNLTRGTKSITRNIAEGSGRRALPDRMRFYDIARASATECAASLDELVDFGFCSEEQVRKAKGLAWRVVSMLIGLIRSQAVARPPVTIP